MAILSENALEILQHIALFSFAIIGWFISKAVNSYLRQVNASKVEAKLLDAPEANVDDVSTDACTSLNREAECSEDVVDAQPAEASAAGAEGTEECCSCQENSTQPAKKSLKKTKKGKKTITNGDKDAADNGNGGTDGLEESKQQLQQQQQPEPKPLSEPPVSDRVARLLAKKAERKARKALELEQQQQQQQQQQEREKEEEKPAEKQELCGQDLTEVKAEASAQQNKDEKEEEKEEDQEGGRGGSDEEVEQMQPKMSTIASEEPKEDPKNDSLEKAGSLPRFIRSFTSTSASTNLGIDDETRTSSKGGSSSGSCHWADIEEDCDWVVQADKQLFGSEERPLDSEEVAEVPQYDQIMGARDGTWWPEVWTSMPMQEVPILPADMGAFQPVWSETGEQYYTDGQELYMLAGMEMVASGDFQGEVPMFRATADPTDPMHQSYLNMTFPNLAAMQMNQGMIEEEENDDAWNTCWGTA